MLVRLKRFCLKIILVLLSVCVLGSCAIHAKFPFICFRWSCITSEFKLPSFKSTGALKKQRKGKANLRKKKRQRKKNKRSKEKGINITDNNSIANNEETPVKKDSLKYSFHTIEEDKFIIIKFTRIVDKADSILVKYPDKGSDISDYDKQILKNYVDSNKVETISLIQVKEHSGSKEDDAHRNKHTSPLRRRIGEFFIQLGIPPERIRLNAGK